jgi:carbohydrate-selective porin OprB
MFQPTPYIYLTPDLQYVINPGGTDIPNALVLGFEAGFTF